MSSAPSTNDPHRRAGSLSELYHSWRHLFWLIGVTGLILVFYAEENWRGYRAWQKYKQMMTARGEILDPAAFIPPPVPDDQNFAMTPALAPLFDFYPGTQKWRSPMAQDALHALTEQFDSAAGLVKPHSLPHPNSWVRGHTDLGEWSAAFDQPLDNRNHRHGPLLANLKSQEGAARVLDALSGFNPILDELRSASLRPRSRFNLRYEEDNPAGILLPHLAKIKYLCQILQLRCSAQLALAHTSEALQDLNLLFYLVDTSHDEPVLISHLVRMGELQMALQPLAEGMGQWSESQLRQIQDRIASFDFFADVGRSLEAERVLFGNGVIEYLRRSHHKMSVLDEFAAAVPAGSSIQVWPLGALFTAAPNGWFYLEERNYSRLFDQYLIPVIDVRNHQIKPQKLVEADAKIAKITGTAPGRRFLDHEFLSALLLPALSKTAEKAAFAQTAVDTATLACALERYRLANGQFPNSLEQLTPTFIPGLPHDIINGQPLSYRLLPGGHYVLYSVGWNGKDDGGVVHHNKNGESDRNEGDWVWTDEF
jgi:hypothetical protein